MYAVGDERARTRFLFRPKIVNGEVRQWCWATWIEEYTVMYRIRYIAPYPYYFWRPIRWAD